MTVVRINAITVPDDGAGLEQRFRSRMGAVDDQPGFLGFELLAPTGENERRWFVVTHWESAEAFDAWTSSQAFTHAHARSSGTPVATGSELLEFDVVVTTPQKVAR